MLLRTGLAVDGERACLTTFISASTPTSCPNDRGFGRFTSGRSLHGMKDHHDATAEWLPELLFPTKLKQAKATFSRIADNPRNVLLRIGPAFGVNVASRLLVIRETNGYL